MKLKVIVNRNRLLFKVIGLRSDPDKDYLPCESKHPNIHPSGPLQTGLSGSTGNGDSTCKRRIEERTNQSKI